MQTETSLPDWLVTATVEDIAVFGIEPDGTASQTLAALAMDNNVDLASIEACLALLRDWRCVLRFEAPVALISYSRTRDRFLVAVDGEISPALQDLTLTRAGIWLLLAALEAGELPQKPDDWGVVMIGATSISGQNAEVIEDYREFGPEREWVSDLQDNDPFLDEWVAARTFWVCAAYCRS